MSSLDTDAERTVLLGGGGTGTSFGMASSLRAVWGDAVRLIVTDTNPPERVTTSLLCDRFVTVPPAADKGFAEAVIEILRSEPVTTYFPILNGEIATACTIRSMPGVGSVDIVATAEGAALCRDKRLLAAWLADLSIPTPRPLDIQSPETDGPWFLKPRDGFGSRSARKITADELRAVHPDERDDMLLQELCHSPEVTVDSFYDARAAWGRAICRERLETKAGVCTKARVFRDEQLQGFAQRIGEALGQRGTICFQVMQARGDWVVTDLNLRPGAGTSMTCAAGTDMLAANFACRWSLPYRCYFPDDQPPDEVIVTRQYADFVMRG